MAMIAEEHTSFASEYTIRGRVVGAGAEPYIVAEMACAHEGKLDRALRMVASTRDAGADAIQIQILKADHQVVPKHHLRTLLERLEFSPDEWRRIVEHTRAAGIHVFAFAYDLPSMHLAKDLAVDGLKLNSSDLSNPELLQFAAEWGVPLHLSTGASTREEIRDALKILKESGASSVVLMHGMQNFPTRVEDANIRRLTALQRAFGLPVGYQDHTDAEAPLSKVIDLIALGMGASVIEKHVTIDRREKGTDYQAALEPLEFAAFVERIRQATAALGSGEFQQLSESERMYRRFQKKSVVAAREIEAGHLVSREDVAFLRTSEEPDLSPAQVHRVLGRHSSRRIAAFEQISTKDVMT